MAPDDRGFDRRTFLRGAGTVTSLAFFGAMASRLGLASGLSLGQAPQAADAVPGAADPGTLEAGLAAFAAKWSGAGPVVAATRFGRFLVHRTFNCHVAGSPRAWSLELAPAGATLTPGRDPTAHADVVLEEEDWLAVLGGDFTGLAPVLNGRAYPRKDEANSTVTLLLVMFVAAHLPAELDGDPRFTEELVRGFFQRGGLPSCEGEPPSFETLAKLEEDPWGRASESVLAPNEVPPVTRTFSAWVHDLSYEDVPAEQIRVAKHQVKSIVGNVYAGSTMGPAGTFRGAIEDFEEPGTATVFGEQRYQTSPRAAAMANSFTSQALEWEDWTRLAHSGAAVVPVALAAAEHAEASGKQLLTAIVAGNEIIARLGGVMTDILHAGQAVPLHQAELPLVAGKLLGLDKQGLASAVGVAATQPQLTSLPAWTSGSKGMITADPADASVRAAQLASAGLSGRGDQLENPLGYIYRLSDVRHPRDLEAAMSDLGEAWWFQEAFYFDKRYPVDGFTLTAVHATLQVRKKLLEAGVNPSDPSQIESIRVHQNLPLASTATMYGEGSPDVLDRVLDPTQPDWTYTALLFDGIYPLVSALLQGSLTQTNYRSPAIQDPDVPAMWEKVYAAPNLSMGVFGAEVQISPAGGDEVRSTIGVPRGEGSMVGCIREDVNEDFDADDKLQLTASTVLSETEIDALASRIDDLESYQNVRNFTATL